MEHKTIGKMMMFGSIVQFCNCEICQAFLSADAENIPTKMGRIVQDTEVSADSTDTETIVDSMDA